MHFDIFHFLRDILGEIAFRRMAVHIGQEFLDILVHFADGSFGVQKDFCRAVAKLQFVPFDATVAEGVDALAFAERVERADENDVGSFQLRVIVAFCHDVDVNHGLVIPGAFGQPAGFADCRLHLDIEDGAIVCLNI